MRTLKPFFLTILLTVCTATITIYGQTTQEEYNYVTKGYKTQLESGLDMKKGYSFQDLNSASMTSGSVKRSCTFKALTRDGETYPCAILCIYTRSDNGFTDYLCIPTFSSSKEIWDQTFDKFMTYSDDGASALIWGMSKLASYLGSE